MSLADMQRDFRTWLVSASGDAAVRLRATTIAGLDVYQNNYRAQLMGCLEAAFPQVRAWIGEDAFLSAAVSHIDNHPPHAWTLDAYPEGFHQTLIELFANNPDVHELAWIESALNESFVAADAEPLSVEALATVDWDNARLRLTPSLLTHVITTNAEEIWSALQEGTAPPEGEMLAQSHGLIVWRRQLMSRLKPVDALELEALVHLQRNGSFAELCDFLVERLGDDEGVARIGALLANWLGSELITGVEEA
ncbi:MAG: putative DNA-binding domain-containing protein [Pseudomonas sp.]